MSETVPGYDTEVWWGLLGPAGMRPDLVAKISRDFVAALKTDAVKERLAKFGASPIGSTPAMTADAPPRIHVIRLGTCRVGCVLPSHGGSSPSRLIE